MSVRSVSLSSLADTAALAAALAPHIAGQVIFLMGTLGSGKTTFVRHLVSQLPGGEHAEVASPSFTLCNIYPTNPEVMHYDLYRLPPGGYDESLEEAVELIENPSARRSRSLLIEWAENMPEILIPENRLEIYWRLPSAPGNADRPQENLREVILKGVGTAENLSIFSDSATPGCFLQAGR